MTVLDVMVGIHLLAPQATTEGDTSYGAGLKREMCWVFRKVKLLGLGHRQHAMVRGAVRHCVASK